MKRFISKYSFKLPRSLAYMLQASEYNISEYIEWYKNVKNFNSVEHRKKLIKTKKSLLLLISLWAIIIIAISTSAYFYIYYSEVNYKYIIPLVIIILLPHLLGYLILLPLLLIKVLIQLPIEKSIIKRATEKLSKNKAIKIAIAGSFGKTSIREILYTVISQKLKVAAPPHSYNTPLGISRFIEKLDGDEDVLIFELGEYYPGDIKKLCELVKPNIGIVTGINDAHLKKFKTIEKTVKTIYEISEFIPSEKLYINEENELANQNAPENVLKYGKYKCNNLTTDDIKTDISGTTFNILKKDEKISVKSKLLGTHQVGPLLAAASIADSLGIGLDAIKEGINKTKPFPHRLEPFTDSVGIITLDDSYNGNPDGVDAIISFISSLKGYRRFYVTPGLVEMGERSASIHRIIGEKLARANIEKVVLINNSVTPYIEEGLKKEKYKGEIIKFDDALKAYNSLKHLTVKGDLVVLQNDWPDQYH
ncbi:MAG: UDP-N-acetylmuramoyl-tripeptide--D-alanyl-D-alanine ligase [Bacteroidetes bacterium]|nr:UDP-N-acetylmuramoyl-tripeptide--D-alanyl-D-alanine ligase [Bacteroidota bacterium]